MTFCFPLILSCNQGATSASQRVSETVDRPDFRTPARAYAIRAKEDRDSPDVIVGTFSIFDKPVHALIDPGSTHSYICLPIVNEGKLQADSLNQDIIVTNPLGHSVIVSKVCRDCPISIHGQTFHGDLIELPFREFDVILGMDWLSKHRVIVDCRSKRITLKTLADHDVVDSIRVWHAIYSLAVLRPNGLHDMILSTHYVSYSFPAF